MSRYLCTQAEGCPGCGTPTGVQRITGTSPKVQAWSCTECTTSWAITIANPRPGSYFDHLAATVGLHGAARSVLRHVIALAEQMDTLTDRQLRDRLRALAESCAR